MSKCGKSMLALMALSAALWAVGRCACPWQKKRGVAADAPAGNYPLE